LSLAQAAQKVQVSAFPEAYAKHESEAKQILGSLGETNSSDFAGMENVGLSNVTGPDQVVQQNGDLNLFAQGIDTPDAAGASAAGSETPSTPGIEAGDMTPQMSATALFDGMDATTPDGGSTFQELFPQQGVVGGSRERVGQLARQLLGTPYVFGGTDPDKGLDCSGFVQYVLRQVGVSLPRISAAQAQAGQRKDIGSLQAGDLVAWDNSSRNNGADHIAIYLGNGQIIEAPRPGLGVRIRSLDNNEGAWGVGLNY
jgi:cell wall-associated NlpC family hydrolase